MEKAAIKLKEQLQIKENNIKLKIKEPENPFVPELLKTMAQKKEEKAAEKIKAEIEEKQKKTHEAIMAEAREPMDDANYLSMVGLRGKLDFNVLVYTPMTGWSPENAYFDGIKYTAPIMQNPWYAQPEDESVFSDMNPPTQDDLVAQQEKLRAIIMEVQQQYTPHEVPVEGQDEVGD